MGDFVESVILPALWFLVLVLLLVAGRYWLKVAGYSGENDKVRSFHLAVGLTTGAFLLLIVSLAWKAFILAWGPVPR